MTPRRWLLAAVAGTALLLLAGRGVAVLYTEYLWFASLGAGDVWRVQTLATITMRTLLGSFGALLVFVNLFAVRHSVASLVMPRRVGNLEIGEEVPGKVLTAGVVLVSGIFGALLSIPHERWTTTVLALTGVPFGETDPFHRADLGEFLYWLPFETSLYYWSLIALLLVCALVVFFYALTPSLRWERGTLYVSAYVRRHLSLLAALVLVLVAWSYRLDAYEVLLHGSGPGGEFTSIDHAVQIPASWALAVISLCAAIIVAYTGWTGQVRIAFVTVTAVLLFSLGLRHAAPLIARRMAEPADPEAREQPYLATRAGYTRRAYAADAVEPTPAGLSYQSLADAARSVPVWDAGALRASIAAGAPSAGRDITIGWMPTEDGLVATILEPAARDGERGAPWSLTRVLAVHADDAGAPVRARSEGRPDDAALQAVVVYPGAGGPLVLSDPDGRLAGAAIASGRSRVAHAWALQNFRLLVEDLPYPRPRLLSRRDLSDRLATVAPFFTQGSRATPIVAGDTLYWAVPLYSTSASHPLSHHYLVAGAERSYVRHAATAVVNGVSGEIALVPARSPDPIARTWMRRFPRLFTAAEQVPEEVLRALPPPVEGVRAQAAAFARYGTRRDPLPRRQLAWDSGGDTLLAGSPEALIVAPGGELMWTVAVLDEVERVEGLIMAVGGRDQRVYWMALSAPTLLRWPDVLSRLEVAHDTALLEDREALVRGRIRAVPIAQEAYFVQPAFTWRSRGAPTLARVAVLGTEGVRTGPTLADVAGVRFGPAAIEGDTREFRARVEALYGAMRNALRRADWQAWGAAFDSLGVLLGTSRQ